MNLIRCSTDCETLKTSGYEYYNTPINLNHVTHVSTGEVKGKKHGDHTRLYTIVFEFVNGVAIEWQFDGQSDRDHTYDILVNNYFRTV